MLKGRGRNVGREAYYSVLLIQFSSRINDQNNVSCCCINLSYQPNYERGERKEEEDKGEKRRRDASRRQRGTVSDYDLVRVDGPSDTTSIHNGASRRCKYHSICMLPISSLFLPLSLLSLPLPLSHIYLPSPSLPLSLPLFLPLSPLSLRARGTYQQEKRV